MDDRPRRRRLRLEGYDYSRNGAYFVTVCTHERKCTLGAVPVGAIHESPVVRLSWAGQCVADTIALLPDRFPMVSVEHSIVMPNHIHLLLLISEPAQGAIRESPLHRCAETGNRRSRLSQVVGYLKMNASKKIHQQIPQMAVWQRGYHDHIVRDEDDFLRIWSYIEENPLKWELDRYYRPE